MPAAMKRPASAVSAPAFKVASPKSKRFKELPSTKKQPKPPSATKQPPLTASAAHAKGSATVEVKADPLTSKCNAIIELLGSAEGYPPEVLQMLTGTVKSCLTLPKEQRHRIHDSTIEMLLEVLDTVTAGQAAKAAALKDRVAEADAEKARREAAAETGSETREKKAQEVTAAKDACDAASAQSSAAYAAASEAEKEQKWGDRDLIAAEGKKNTLETMMTGALASLKEGIPDGPSSEAAALCNKILKVGADFRFDAQLMTSASPALLKVPGQRGQFDRVVIQQLEQSCTEAIAALAEQLANGEESKAQRAAKVAAAKEQSDATDTHMLVCMESSKEAKVALEEAEAAKQIAITSLADFGPEMQQVSVDLEAAITRQRECEEVVGTFKELVEGSPAATPAETPAPPEVTATDTA